jgi:transposase-like protein
MTPSLPPARRPTARPVRRDEAIGGLLDRGLDARRHQSAEVLTLGGIPKSEDRSFNIVAMGQPIAVRTDFTAVEMRRLARRAKDGDQVRRLLAVAVVLDGASRADAAKVGGMDRQTLRDWVIRFDEQGPDMVRSMFPRQVRRRSSIRSTERLWRGSWTKGRSRPSMAWCPGAPVT